MGYSAWPLKYLPVQLRKPVFEPDLLYPVLGLSEQKELEDLQATFLKHTKNIGMQLVEAQEAYLEDCAKKLGMSIEELAKNYKLESRLKDSSVDAPLPAASDEFRIMYEFRLVPRRS